MIEITIRQKDSIIHTKFIIAGSGEPFPEDNFDIAVEWMTQGLLDDQTCSILKKIQEGMK